MILSGSRISHQLREYQLGIYSFYTSSEPCNFCRKSAAAPPVSSRIFPFNFDYNLYSKRLFSLKLFRTNASSPSSSSSSSSSSIANNNDDTVGVASINGDSSVQNTPQTPLLSDCLSPVEDGQEPPSERLSPVAGGIVALGKFDALHVGHRELAIQAAKIGVPFLLSFAGMAEILGWKPRVPVVAKCDRKRILTSWSPLCCNFIPREFQVEFSKVRYLTPQQFIEKLSKELGVRGVVAGQNYRFGYKAAGDASDLVRLCKDYGMRACIINSVMDKKQESRNVAYSNSQEQGQVSSTRVRHALAAGDVKYVSELLGRHHRLILQVEDKEKFFREKTRWTAPRSCLLNLPPREGLYPSCSLVINDESVVPCRVIIDSANVHLELDGLSPYENITARSLGLLGIDLVG